MDVMAHLDFFPTGNTVHLANPMLLRLEYYVALICVCHLFAPDQKNEMNDLHEMKLVETTTDFDFPVWRKTRVLTMRTS